MPVPAPYRQYGMQALRQAQESHGSEAGSSTPGPSPGATGRHCPSTLRQAQESRAQDRRGGRGLFSYQRRRRGTGALERRQAVAGGGSILPRTRSTTGGHYGDQQADRWNRDDRQRLRGGLSHRGVQASHRNGGPPGRGLRSPARGARRLREEARVREGLLEPGRGTGRPRRGHGGRMRAQQVPRGHGRPVAQGRKACGNREAVHRRIRAGAGRRGVAAVPERRPGERRPDDPGRAGLGPYHHVRGEPHLRAGRPEGEAPARRRRHAHPADRGRGVPQRHPLAVRHGVGNQRGRKPVQQGLPLAGSRPSPEVRGGQAAPGEDGSAPSGSWPPSRT